MQPIIEPTTIIETTRVETKTESTKNDSTADKQRLSATANKPKDEKNAYDARFQKVVDQVKSEGRYRVFAELSRHAKAFPKATVPGLSSVVRFRRVFVCQFLAVDY